MLPSAAAQQVVTMAAQFDDRDSEQNASAQTGRASTQSRYLIPLSAKHPTSFATRRRRILISAVGQRRRQFHPLPRGREMRPIHLPALQGFRSTQEDQGDSIVKQEQGKATLQTFQNVNE